MAVAPGTELSDIVGSDHIRAPGAGEFEADGLAPEVIASPGSYDGVAGVLRQANAHGLAVIPFGGGTMMHLGNPPAKYDIALDLSRLHAVVEYEPADLTVTCQGGMTLKALQDRLGEAGQTLPLGPFADRRATIGGILASNRIGALVHGYGRPRDMTIGMRVATADGRIARAGGRVVKNVAGYDMCKLHIGALGTLGVIVEATFKVSPLAIAERLCTLTMPDVTEACALAAEAERIGLPARRIELVLDGDDCFLTINLAGSPRAIERSGAEVESLAAHHGGKLAGQAEFPASMEGASFVCRLGVQPTRVAEVLTMLRGLRPTPGVVSWPAVGIVFAGWREHEDELRAVRELAKRSGATMVVERCSVQAKQSIDVFGDPPPSFPLMRAIKQQFDPNGILSPGRFVGRL